MNKKFIEYLASIGLTEPIFKRVITIFEFYNSICVSKIEDIQVSEYIKADGSREYESLWFFSDQFVMEAKQFLTEDNFDISPIKNIITRWEIKKKNYDFNKATDNSRLVVTFHTKLNIVGILKSSKKNCDHLKSIALKYCKPNLVKC